MSSSFDRAVLDHLRLALRDESGAFAARVIATFVRQGEELVDELERAAGAQDVVAASEAAHKLRGSCGSVGGLRLAGLCDEIEHRPGSALELSSKVDLLRGELRRLNDELAAYS